MWSKKISETANGQTKRQPVITPRLVPAPRGTARVR